MIMLKSKDFRERDIYIDFPFESAKFRWDKDARKVYRRFYGEAEMEIPHDSKLWTEAVIAGRLIAREEYERD